MSDHGSLTPQTASGNGRAASSNGQANGRETSPPSNGSPGSNWQRLALDAHSDMESYRRVLAAAVANEKNALERVTQSQALADGVQAELSREAHARGVFEGRVRELERERDTAAERLGIATREVGHLRTEHLSELKVLTETASNANARIAHLEAQANVMRRERHGLGFLALRLRSRVLVVAAVANYLLALGFFARMATQLVSTDVVPLQLLGMTLALFLIGVLCHGQAASAIARELRQETE